MNLERAIEIASRAHKGQLDKNNQPYILHPLRVMLSMNCNKERIVAVLHDVLEDTNTKESYLRSLFGDEITDAVVAISKRDGETYLGFIERCCKNALAKSVKKVDISDNASPARLYQLPPDDRTRLRIKYTKALNYIDNL